MIFLNFFTITVVLNDVSGTKTETAVTDLDKCLVKFLEIESNDDAADSDLFSRLYQGMVSIL